MSLATPIHPFLIANVICLLLLPSGVGADGGDLIWFFPGIEDVHSIAEIEDQDSDGVPDIVIETYDAGATGDHVYCLSGASPGGPATVIWSAKPAGGPSSSGGYEDECLAIAPDITGDGIEDVLLGTAWGGRSAYVLRGDSGDVWYHFDTYADSPPLPVESGWVYTIRPVPDTDGDGITDIFFGCGSDNDGAYHVSPRDGITLWYKNLGDAVFTCDAFDDVDGDTVPDGAFGVGDNADAVWMMPGGAHNPVTSIWNRPMPGTVMSLTRIPDISSDGVNDVIAGAWSQSDQVFAFDGTNGDTIWTADVGNFNYVMKVVALDDVTGDGLPDVAVGTFDNVARVLSGLDGALVWSDTVRTLNGGDIWAVGRVEDVTGDGINDVVAGSFDYRVYLYDGTDGNRIWEYNTGNRLYFVDGVSDISGNGVPDVVAGTQYLSSGGRCYLLEGNVPTSVPNGAPAVAARPVDGGAEVRIDSELLLRYARFHVERLDIDEESLSKAASFKRELVVSHDRGELSTDELIAARRLTPGPRWVRLTESPLSTGGGELVYVDRTVLAGGTYSYRFVLIDEDGAEFFSPTADIRMPGGSVPGLALPVLAARPNPFNPSATFEFSMPPGGSARLSLYGLNGRKIVDLYQGEGESGTVLVEWDGRDREGRLLPSGVYFARLEGRGYSVAEKITIVR